MTARKRRLQSSRVPARSDVIYANESGRFWCVYERARYVREPQFTCCFASSCSPTAW